MKGPSIEAIRKFKEDQQKKKQEEDERKIKEKLSTLEHRAAQGDRKAKIELKKIEKITESRKNLELTNGRDAGRSAETRPASYKTQSSKGHCDKKPKKAEVDFDELMRMAKQNNNEIRKPEEPKQKSLPQIRKKVRIDPSPQSHQQVGLQSKLQPQIRQQPQPQPQTRQRPPELITQRAIKPSTHRATSQSHQSREPILAPIRKPERVPGRPLPTDRFGVQSRLPIRPNQIYNQSRSRYGYDDDDYDDESDLSDFVVDEDEDDVQDEVSRTIRSVFKYDKRRCDRREEELDRLSRQIGRVENFEDLEREERRASRLAAAEDAKALREEEDRKRQKALRAKKYR